MALITDLPTNASPSTSDYMITDDGTTTSKTTLQNIKSALSLSGLAISSMTLTNSASNSFTVPNNSRHFLVSSGPLTTIHGMWIIAASSSGAIQRTEITKGSALTVSASTNTLTIVSSATSNATITDFCISGSIMTKN